MRSNGHDRQNGCSLSPFDPVRPIDEEYSVRTSGLVLDIRLEDFFASRPIQRAEGMRVERRMPEIGLQQAESLPYLLQDSAFCCGLFQSSKVTDRFRCEQELAIHSSSSANCAKERPGRTF